MEITLAPGGEFTHDAPQQKWHFAGHNRMTAQSMSCIF